MLGERQDRDGLFAEVESLPFMNGSFEVDTLVEEANHVACRYRFFADGPGGHSIAFSGMFIAVMRDGQLTSGWGEYDATRVRRQLAR
jgi:predicted ester cyclase